MSLDAVFLRYIAAMCLMLLGIWLLEKLTMNWRGLWFLNKEERRRMLAEASFSYRFRRIARVVCIPVLWVVVALVTAAAGLVFMFFWELAGYWWS